VDGDARTEDCLVVPEIVLAIWPSPFSMTPNSLVESSVGEGFVEAARPLILTLTLRLVTLDTEFFNGGDAPAEVRLEMRGILVGVSFRLPDMEFIKDDGGGSLASFDV
jgi:hypothetical protein